MKRVKYCGHCKTIKFMSEFNSHADTHDGKQSWCRACKNKVDLERYYDRKGVSRKA